MAESEYVPLPDDIVVADVVVKTQTGRRRNRYYYKWEDAVAWAFEDTAKVADAIFEHFQEAYCAVMSSLNEFEKVEVKILTAGDDQFEDTSTLDPVEGDIEVALGEGLGDGDALPDEVTLNLKIQTGLVGRARRGRRFVSGLAETVQTSGSIHEDFKNECKAVAAKVPENITVEGLGPEETNTVILFARHWNRKGNVMDPIVGCRAMGSVGTRKDRRRPLTFEALP